MNFPTITIDPEVSSPTLSRPRADVLAEIDELRQEVERHRSKAEMWRRMLDFARRHREPVFPD